MLRGDGLVALPGTVRALTPEQTWEAVAGRLPEFGITRVADLTGLDCVGLPVFTAIRPASLTLSTSQGKGATGLLAKLSAVMEAIELWHVEQPLPVAAYGPACEVAPGCPVTALPLTVPCPAHILARMVWEWTCGTGLVGGEKVLLPVDLVRRRVQRPQWSPDLLRATSTGLACGNSRDEALLHALFEVVERDVLYRDGQSGGRRRTLIAPGDGRGPPRTGGGRPSGGRGHGAGDRAGGRPDGPASPRPSTPRPPPANCRRPWPRFPPTGSPRCSTCCKPVLCRSAAASTSFGWHFTLADLSDHRRPTTDDVAEAIRLRTGQEP